MGEEPGSPAAHYSGPSSLPQPDFSGEVTNQVTEWLHILRKCLGGAHEPAMELALGTEATSSHTGQWPVRESTVAEEAADYCRLGHRTQGSP